jgi:hypothetical protein
MFFIFVFLAYAALNIKANSLTVDQVPANVKSQSYDHKLQRQRILVTSRGARFFLVKYTNTGKNIPNSHKIYQMAIK